MFQITMRTSPSCGRSNDSAPLGSSLLRGTQSGATWSTPVGAAGERGASPSASDLGVARARLGVLLALALAAVLAARFVIPTEARETRRAVRSMRRAVLTNPFTRRVHLQDVRGARVAALVCNGGRCR